MVEINNQRKAFLDMLAWSEAVTDVRKPEIMVMTSAEMTVTITPIHPPPHQACHAKPKTQINRRRTYQLLSRWWDAYRKQLGLKDFSPKSQDAVALQQIKERGALPMIDLVISVRQSTVAAISGSCCRALVMAVRTPTDSLVQNSKKRAERSERLMYEQNSPRLSPLWLSASSAIMGC